jgi:hypothetical protein
VGRRSLSPKLGKHPKFHIVCLKEVVLQVEIRRQTTLLIKVSLPPTRPMLVSTSSALKSKQTHTCNQYSRVCFTLHQHIRNPKQPYQTQRQVAVVGPDGFQATRMVRGAEGASRAANMVAFARAGLELLEQSVRSKGNETTATPPLSKL